MSTSLPRSSTTPTGWPSSRRRPMNTASCSTLAPASATSSRRLGPSAPPGSFCAPPRRLPASGRRPGESADALLDAYDDAEGVTAAFNRNILVRLNRELDADFDPDAFVHRALWNALDSRIEMHLVSREGADRAPAGMPISPSTLRAASRSTPRTAINTNPVRRKHCSLPPASRPI